MRPDPSPPQPPQPGQPEQPGQPAQPGYPAPPAPPGPTEPEIPPIVPEPEIVPPSIPEKPDLPPTPHAGEKEAVEHATNPRKGDAYKWSTDDDELRELVLEGPDTRPAESEPQ